MKFNRQSKPYHPRMAQLANEIMRDVKCCEQCGSKTNLTLHHLIPIEEGGLEMRDNLQKLCEKCHHELHKAIDREKKK